MATARAMHAIARAMNATAVACLGASVICLTLEVNGISYPYSLSFCIARNGGRKEPLAE